VPSTNTPDASVLNIKEGNTARSSPRLAICCNGSNKTNVSGSNNAQRTFATISNDRTENPNENLNNVIWTSMDISEEYIAPSFRVQ
jgi:hypothetical protein